MIREHLLRSARCALLAAFLAGAALAQQAGSLDGFALTDDGEPLEGVAVTLSGRTGTYHATSDRQGALSILNMEPGNYALRAARDGYQPASSGAVEILVGRTTSIQIRMSRLPGETIVVTSEPPILATRPEAQGIRVTSFELDVIPTTRDPWAVVAQAPGVLLDTVNAGGNKNNLQPTFLGPGTERRQNAFLLDGVQVTDMTTAGTSPLHYDFDGLEEVRVTVGGPDAAAPTGGVLVDLVTKRGTDVWRGSARDFETDSRLQASPRQPEIVRPSNPPGRIDPEEIPPPRGGLGGGRRITGFSASAEPSPATDPGNGGGTTLSVGKIKGIDDYGLEAGGPLLRRRLFVWGSYGTTSSQQIAVGGTPDRARIENFAVKANLQIGSGHSLAGTMHRADKTRRDVGAGPERGIDTLARLVGRTEIMKLEDSILLRGNVYATAFASRLDGNFVSSPYSGPDAEILLDPEGIWRGSYASSRNRRDSRHLQVDLRGFVSSRHGSHEPRIGASERRFSSEDEEHWGPRNLINISGENSGTLYDIVRALRPGKVGSSQRYLSLWAQDEVRANRLTATVGLRYDHQQGESLAASTAANPAFPLLLPAVDYSGGNPAFRWRSLSPRIGISYARGEDRHTVVRAGYSRFAGQLHTTLVDRLNPLGTSSATLGFLDLDGDGIYDAGEPNFLLATQGIDPRSPGDLASPNRTDPDLAPEITDEFTFGVERLIRPQLVANLRWTSRQSSNLLETRRYVRDIHGQVRLATAADYRLWDTMRGTLPNGRKYAAPVYTLDPSLQPTGGRLLVNGDRSQSYGGLTFGLTKRLSHGWMLRGHATWSHWYWNVGRQFRFYDDPTDLAPGNGNDSGDGDNQGEAVVDQAPGSGSFEGAFLNSRWSFNLNGMVQIAPARAWGFNLAANVSGRQGYPIVWAVRETPPDGIARNVQVTGHPDAGRYDDVYLFDLRLEKEWIFREASAVVSIDGFNLLNRDTALSRERFVNSPQAHALREALGPRVFRLGLRLRWR